MEVLDVEPSLHDRADRPYQLIAPRGAVGMPVARPNRKDTWSIRQPLPFRAEPVRSAPSCPPRQNAMFVRL